MHGKVDLSRPDNSEYQKGRSALVQALWYFTGLPLLRSHLVPISRLKCAVLRLFGAKIGRGVYIKPGVRVKFPWYLTVGDFCWLGEDLWIDNLAAVEIESDVCISQGAYLCTGNHDWTTPNMKLFRRPIRIESGSWIGARAILCPGVVIGSGSVIAAGSVVTREIGPYQVWAGNPAVYVRERRLKSAARSENNDELLTALK
ncbi:MAG TPA: WcaF family extracellular polysaccharide biosynthesis acetyltransferase [Bryobacteraceae bacterium]|nr:WcaF family extracellular polysaccharide biosynthesis acetyltransferase [Bryobacteraceae bacterium]